MNDFHLFLDILDHNILVTAMLRLYDLLLILVFTILDVILIGVVDGLEEVLCIGLKTLPFLHHQLVFFQLQIYLFEPGLN